MNVVTELILVLISAALVNNVIRSQFLGPVSYTHLAFQLPEKPIGIFYTKEEAEVLKKEKGYTMREDAGRGWRRVVASPKPVEIVEFETLKRLWDSTIEMCIRDSPSGDQQ